MVTDMANEQQNEIKNGSGSGNRRRIKIGALTIMVLAVSTLIYWWFFLRNQVTTDDAYARADSAMVSSRIAGTVTRVLVDNDYAVEAGCPLVELDTADCRIAVSRARATLEEDEANLKSAQVMVPPVSIQTSAQVQSAEAALKAARDTESQTRHNIEQLKSSRVAATADLAQAERDFNRFETLSVSGAGTQRQEEQAKTGLDKAKAQVKAIDAQIAALESALAAASQQVTRAGAQLQTAKSELANVDVQASKVDSLKAKRDKSAADLEMAGLNLSYCTIPAPINGFIAQKSVQVGDRVQPGQAMMAVVPLKQIYVEANFKETQLTNVRVGQPVSISADIYPGFQFRGKVAGIRAGTGAAFSLIPPENATGNWIKVVQRIPVRIELDEPPPSDHPLRVGASLEVSVSVADRSGPSLLQASPAAISRPSGKNDRPK
jgi:membrane fusion protein (multidrug efflux system)